MTPNDNLVDVLTLCDVLYVIGRARAVGQRPQSESLCRHRVEPIRRDHVVGELCSLRRVGAGRRVVDRVDKSLAGQKAPFAHRLRGYRSRERPTSAQAQALIIAEEESLVFDNRAPEYAAELVGLEWVFTGGEKVFSVERFIAQVFKQRAVIFVRAGT